jgi:pimeloyl-ACP methyl ester carboxylesterase
MSTERTWSFIKYNWVYNKSVHTSCHGGGCWRKLTHILCKSGHEVYTPTLTGLGERSHLLTKVIGLDTHIKDIFQVMEYEDLNNVILVGHSYRVLVIGGVAEKIPHRIKHLVYLDGYIYRRMARVPSIWYLCLRYLWEKIHERASRPTLWCYSLRSNQPTRYCLDGYSSMSYALVHAWPTVGDSIYRVKEFT